MNRTQIASTIAALAIATTAAAVPAQAGQKQLSAMPTMAKSLAQTVRTPVAKTAPTGATAIIDPYPTARIAPAMGRRLAAAVAAAKAAGAAKQTTLPQLPGLDSVAATRIVQPKLPALKAGKALEQVRTASRIDNALGVTGSGSGSGTIGSVLNKIRGQSFGPKTEFGANKIESLRAFGPDQDASEESLAGMIAQRNSWLMDCSGFNGPCNIDPESGTGHGEWKDPNGDARITVNVSPNRTDRWDYRPETGEGFDTTVEQQDNGTTRTTVVYYVKRNNKSDNGLLDPSNFEFVEKGSNSVVTDADGNVLENNPKGENPPSQGMVLFWGDLASGAGDGLMATKKSDDGNGGSSDDETEDIMRVADDQDTTSCPPGSPCETYAPPMSPEQAAAILKAGRDFVMGTTTTPKPEDDVATGMIDPNAAQTAKKRALDQRVNPNPDDHEVDAATEAEARARGLAAIENFADPLINPVR